MSKIVQRLLLFFIGIPLILGAVYIFPFYNHLILHILIIAVTFISALEMHNILKHRMPVHNGIFMAVLSTLLPTVAALCAVFNLNGALITFIFAFSFLIMLVVETFSPNSGTFENSLPRICSSSLILIYPGFLVTFLSRMTMWEHSVALLTTFLLMVFACDSLAWVCGVTMGKGNRGFIAASPNKSVAGFIGGFAGSILAGVAARFIFPEIFGSSIITLCLLGAVTAFASILGDLAESVFKRSGMVKDSGTIVPGRGGFLDSIDSILMAAPVFYVMTALLFSIRP